MGPFFIVQSAGIYSNRQADALKWGSSGPLPRGNVGFVKHQLSSVRSREALYPWLEMSRSGTRLTSLGTSSLASVIIFLSFNFLKSALHFISNFNVQFIITIVNIFGIPYEPATL